MASNNNQNGWFSGFGIGFSSGGSSSNPSAEKPAQSPSGSQPDMMHFEQLDRTTTGTNTLKRNTKIEFTRSDLLQLLSYYEGEFQARDIVIAALKSEKMKEAATLGRYRPVVLNDPYTALLRDMFADGLAVKPPYSDKDIAMLADQQLEALENLVVQQRRAQLHMTNILREAEVKHKKVIQELEEEKCKHEHDTAQGDDITYGLEMERTRLKQELDLERQARKKLEKELKRQMEITDEEKVRQKQIVLLLLAERKKIILKYIEERKRSEDLAQILSEEKSRIDSMAEGLEEESKKSLQMEAELEKQMQLFDIDRKSFQKSVADQEKWCRDLEVENRKMKIENDALRGQLMPVRLNKSLTSSRATEDTSSVAMTSSVAKVVQPTATISSVPVSAPTTGIAQSILPGQVLRQNVIPATVVVVASSKIPSVKSPTSGTRMYSPASVSSTVVGTASNIVAISTGASIIAPTVGNLGTQVTGKVPFNNSPTTSAAVATTVPAAITLTPTQPTPPKKGIVMGRGLPPPIPPNKPVIVGKQSVTRRCDQTDTEKKKLGSISTGKDTAFKTAPGGINKTIGNAEDDNLTDRCSQVQGIDI